MQRTCLQYALVLSALALVPCQGYPDFQDRIPNGNRVPHPCLDNYLWGGLGHKDSNGGGERNVFGMDFDKNGKKWDKCLCEHDSDGDGRTNGEELGDPDCVWKEGDIPARVDHITHPGVCEPLDSPVCQEQNDWEFCSLDPFVCEATNEPDVVEHRIEFTPTAIPPNETNYFCMTFELPTDQDYHLIAFKPLLDNTRVIHHMLVYGCEEQYDEYSSPTECGMAVTCVQLVAIWGLGTSGECFPDVYGVRVGKTGFKNVMLQVHWNNPELLDDQVDASGMALYLTPHLRPNNAGILAVGTIDIVIPGRTEQHTVQGECDGSCTQALPHPINLDYTYLHMHYLGASTSLSQTSDGVTKVLVSEEHYSYDNPLPYRLTDVTLSPGDSLSISCTYNTNHKHAATLYGEGTSDEMCYGFVIYYPEVPLWGWCTSYETAHFCPEEDFHLPSCNVQELFDPANLEAMLTDMWSAVAPVCGVPGAGPDNCPPGCQETVAEVRANDTCLQGVSGQFIEFNVIKCCYGNWGDQLLSLLHTCDPEWDRTITDPEYGLGQLPSSTPTSPTTPLVDAECVLSGTADWGPNVLVVVLMSGFGLASY